eukprot:jgi/Bigna1/68161/fgenesh1_pg.5_\
MPTLRSLGPGLLSSIATYLDVHSLCRLEITCRRLREDLDQGVAWQAATARIACGPQPESVAVATAKLPAPSSNLSRRRSSRLVERNPMMGKKSFLAHGKKTVERTINALLEVNSIAESARQVKLGAKLRRILKRWGPVLINYTNHIDTFLTTVCNWDTSEATIIASVRYLVRTMGADVNVAPDFSPLCLAAARGFPNLIKFFLELGADPTVKGRGSIKIKGTIVTGEYDALGWARAALAITGSKRDEYIVQMLEKASAAVASAAVVSLTPTAVLNEEDKKGRKSSEQPAHSPCEPGNKMYIHTISAAPQCRAHTPLSRVMPKVWSVGRIVVVKYGSGAGRGIKWPALIWDEDILCDEVLNARGKNGKEKISVRFIGDNRQFGWVQDKDVFAFREEYARGDGRAGETQVPTVKLQRAYDHARRLRAGEQLKEYENWEEREGGCGD